MIQKMLETLSEWCHNHNIGYDLLEYNDGYAVSLPILRIDETIDLVATCGVSNKAIYENRLILWMGDGTINEDQLKFPWGKIIRKQSSFPSSFGPSKSFGGITTRTKKKQKIAEEISVTGDTQPNTTLDAKSGKLIIQDQTVIDGHANVLQALVGWLATNSMPTLQQAIDDIGNAVKQGAEFTGPQERA